MGTKRHKFQLSRIALFMGWGEAGPAITAISKARPAVVTSAGHGLAAGDVVNVEDVLGMTEANGTWVANVLTANTYELVGSNSTGWGTYASGGTSAKANFGNWCEVTNFQRQGGSKAEIVVSGLCDDAEQIELGIAGFGTASFTTNWAPDTALQVAVDLAYETGDVFPIQYQPRGAKTQTTLLGFIQQTGESAASGGIWTGSVNYRITGKPMRVQLAEALA